MADSGRSSSTGGGDFGEFSGIAGLDEAPLPTCYRHPDRETGVSCSSCGRPICPDCMTPAPVGFRCPVCMDEQRQGQGRAQVITRQQTRSRWQSGMTGSRGFSITKLLIVANVIMFVVELATGAIGLMGGGSTKALANVGALIPYYVLYENQYWRLVSSMFLHGSIIHLLFNMWALWVIGEFLENTLGRLRYLIVYFVAGIGGSVLVVLTVGAGDVAALVTPTVGASGAIFGLFAGLFTYAYLNRGRDIVAQNLVGQLAFIIIINLVFTFSASGISWQGHIGGLVTGGLLVLALTLGGRKSMREGIGWEDGGLAAAIFIAILGALVWKVANAPPLAAEVVQLIRSVTGQ